MKTRNYVNNLWEDLNINENTKKNLLNVKENSNEIESSFKDKLDKLLKEFEVNKQINQNYQLKGHYSYEELKKISKIFPLEQELNLHLKQYTEDENKNYDEFISFEENNGHTEHYDFIIDINQLTLIIENEITLFYVFLKKQYNRIFDELETLVSNSVDYSKVILIIKQDLENTKQYQDELKQLLSNEKVLLLTMAAFQQSKKVIKVEKQEMETIENICKVIIKLDELKKKIISFISQKITKFAPNIKYILGSFVTSKLLCKVGSLKQLALTPPCNLSVIGSKELSSKNKIISTKKTKCGYLQECELMNSIPNDLFSSVIRIISAKVILAARIDLSKSYPSGEMGLKFYNEIKQKIQKLLDPPMIRPVKTLPIPIEEKSKKRGGKRARKYKEMFQVSELKKAQNRMAFLKEEAFVVDSFGEVIGLGMSRNSTFNSESSHIKLDTKTSSKMSKILVNRLKKEKTNSKFLYKHDDFESLVNLKN